MVQNVHKALKQNDYTRKASTRDLRGFQDRVSFKKIWEILIICSSRKRVRFLSFFKKYLLKDIFIKINSPLSYCTSVQAKIF